MKIIDGVKYINIEDFDGAVTKVIDHLTDIAMHSKTDPMSAMMTGLLITAELAKVKHILLSDEEEEEKKDEKKEEGK
ncbi:MAG: hypothetical protein J6Y78_15260 [Paludibacteraceae bacterium]|nr:hypothetical protein [Paludibacteraceae bacterium]